MRKPPQDIKLDTISNIIKRQWGIENTKLTHKAVGAGGYHWDLDTEDKSWFVTVNDLRKGPDGSNIESAYLSLQRSLETAAVLASEHGLSFIVGPIPDKHGDVLQRIEDTPYSISVFPRLDITDSDPTGEYASEDDRQMAIKMIASLHSSTIHLRAKHFPIRRDDLSIPRRADLRLLLSTNSMIIGPLAL